MRERRFGWLCIVVACAAMAMCIVMPPVAAQTSKPGNTVNLELKDTDVKSAIEVLFRNTGKNFSIDPNVQGTIAALSIKDVPFDTALRSLTKSAGLVYRQDGTVYIISMKPDMSTIANNPPPPQIETAPVDEPTTEPEVRIEKIALNNVSASEILGILTGQQNRSYGGYGLGNSYGGSSGMMGGGYGTMGGGYGSSRYGGGTGYGSSMGYGGGYGMNSGYGGGYNSGYGNRNNGYGSGGYGSPTGLPGGAAGGYGTGTYSRGW